jgi:hypothetical protein
MKKSWIYISLLVVLAVVAVYLYLQDQKSTLDASFSTFGLKKDQQVDSVLIRRGNQQVKLHREADQWYVNESLFARSQAIDQFFNLLEDIRVEAPAPRENRDELVEQIQAHAIHLQIYKKNQRIRDYLVEASPNRKENTYMMVTGSRQPFLMSLPGYSQDLAPLFRANAEYWRDRTLFDYEGPELNLVQVTYPEKPQASFTLSYQQDRFDLKQPQTNQPGGKFSSNKAARYFSYFSNVRFHSVISDDRRLIDSLGKAQPYCTIEITDRQGNHRKLLTYRKSSRGKKDAFGQKTPWDLNYLYGQYGHSEEILLIKYTEIDPLLKEIDYFREN